MKNIITKVFLLIEFFQTVISKFGLDVFFRCYGAQTKYFGAKLIFSIPDSESTEKSFEKTRRCHLTSFI